MAEIAPWKKAWQLLDAAGYKPVGSKSGVFALLAENKSAAAFLNTKNAALAGELEIEIELPPEVLRLELKCNVPSIELGREILNMTTDSARLMEYLPHKKGIINASINLWQDDQNKKLLDDLAVRQERTAKLKEQTRKSIAKGGASMPRARHEQRKAAERRLVREAKAEGRI